MNWWLFGLCMAVLLLWIRQVGAAIRWNQIVKSLGALSDVVAAIGGIPQDKIDESRKVWTEARIQAEKSQAVTSVWMVLVVIFLISLMVHGRI